MEIVASLIGCFNLDPNRVLDIILESFETRPEQDKLFIPLIQSYMSDGGIICEVLGYKYRHFADTETPSSLYKVTALLLQSGVIALDDIYSWLSPSDKSIITDWEADMTDAKEFVRKLNIISTNKDNQTEPEPEREMTQEKFSLNQKWGLCEALLCIGDWSTTQKLIKKLPEQSIVVNEQIAKALCKLIHIVIDPIYRNKCLITSIKGKSIPAHENKLAPQPVNTMEDLRLNAFPMFIALGPSLQNDPVLLYKLIRIMRVILTDLKIDPNNSTPIEEDSLYYNILTLLDVCVLPSLSYMDCNCCIAEEIWSVIKFYPYQHR